MKKIIIKIQHEIDSLDINVVGEIIIVGTLHKINKFYKNAEIHICENAQITNVSDSAQIAYVYGSAQITNVSGSAQITHVSDSAQITYVYGSAQITNVSGSAQITHVSDSAQITYVYGSAQITHVSGSAQITNVYGSANILFINEQAIISTKGKNIVSYYNDKSVNLNCSKQTTIVILQRDKSNWDSYINTYHVKFIQKKAVLYKAVRKNEKGYFSDYDPSFKYEIGKTITASCDKNKNKECSFGIHLSHKMWALNFGKGWSNMALLECEVDITKIVVPIHCDGKIRTSVIKVIREIPQNEFYN